jgi:hypothetical protein
MFLGADPNYTKTGNSFCCTKHVITVGKLMYNPLVLRDMQKYVYFSICISRDYITRQHRNRPHKGTNAARVDFGLRWNRLLWPCANNIRSLWVLTRVPYRIEPPHPTHRYRFWKHRIVLHVLEQIRYLIISIYTENILLFAILVIILHLYPDHKFKIRKATRYYTF